MERSEASARLTVLERAEALKDVFRSGFTAEGRPESTAAHTWRLCLWVLMFEDQCDGLDIARLLKLSVLHDLGEAVSGDIPATEQTSDKGAGERADFVSLLEGLPREQIDGLLELWDEYENAASPEARLIKGLDKLETILQHTQGRNPADFDYGFNLKYGQRYMDGHPLLQTLRPLLDEKTRARMKG